jgi:DNA-binding NarL/FixJ family response regulator
VDNAVRILLADEQGLFREAVRLVLDSQADLQVVAETAEPRTACAEAERTAPDVALIDASVDAETSLRACSAIVDRAVPCRVLVIADREDPALLVEALEAGAAGYLTKNVPLSELIHAVRAVHQGETIVPGRMLGPLLQRLIRRRREQRDALDRMSRLTRREREVLGLLAEGADNDTIAERLVISPETARTHVQNVLVKLEVHSRVEAAAFVMRHDMLDALTGAGER